MFKDKTIHTLLYTYAITHPDCKTSWIDDYEKVAVDIWPDVTKLDSPPLINHLSLTEFLIHLPIWISK
jgi:hypothetical protein